MQPRKHGDKGAARLQEVAGKGNQANGSHSILSEIAAFDCRY